MHGSQRTMSESGEGARELAGHARRTALEPWHTDVMAAVPTPV
jgi:hypothetical protein